MEQLVPFGFMKKGDEFGLEKQSFISSKGVLKDGISSTTAKFSRVLRILYTCFELSNLFFSYSGNM
jgi:hypothetical protein